MFIESQCLLASEEPGGKFSPLLSTVSVLPTHSSQNFCTNKHFILSIDPKHTLKWLAEEELPYLSYIQYLPYQKGKSLVCGNDRERDKLQLHPQCSRFLSLPAFLSSLGSVTLLPWGCPNSPAALMKPLGPAKDLQCKGEDIPCLVPLRSSCCQCHWCHTLWSLSTKSSSLAWEGSMTLPKELIDLWEKGTGGKISGNSLYISRL